MSAAVWCTPIRTAIIVSTNNAVRADNGLRATGGTAVRAGRFSAVSALVLLSVLSLVGATVPPASGIGGPAPLRSPLPLTGLTVVLDPGHNPGNWRHPSEINRLVDIGNGRKACNTTGTETRSGYTEAAFTLDLARRVRVLLEAEGARVVMTQDGNLPWGPCVTERAAIGNRAHANAVVAIHADGAAPSGHGFHVILPARVVAGAADTRAIVGPSRRLGVTLRNAFTSLTGEPFATYLGGGTGLMVRSDLGGLNLSRVPAVFIECGNMRNTADAARLSAPGWRELAAHGIALGITRFLTGARVSTADIGAALSLTPDGGGSD
ncbi:N-acetylmuramoyl-L-alanine amidase [Streptacidiphilus jiangxiensis]|uniref:N-acetylmuramoyl-L-alanine amidase n=1 Tax=Streptacidiphilus jiangxiensis TaxID=235985 RepID=A0A1H7UAU9_STRJI|nr:N-acetylmuramoyl-L-alanine amidase [Streptacidiphilus jiangxiensis]SEL94081.1 N-acetylmuramoyl-L-alanine amidase [Streptacidiphilus jiangxiensis]